MTGEYGEAVRLREAIAEHRRAIRRNANGPYADADVDLWAAAGLPDEE